MLEMKEKMKHQVFISYSELDHQVADMICAALESASIRCWIAHRDVPPGHRWGDLIFDALEQSEVFILILSANTEKSPWVTDELTLAMDKNKKIIPFQIEKISPKRGIVKALKVRSQWINAYTKPRQDAVNHLVRTVSKDLAVEKEKAANPIPTKVVVDETSIFKILVRRKITWVITFLIIALLLTITGLWKKGDIVSGSGGKISHAVTENELLKELESKGLMEKLKNAKAYHDAGNPESEYEALKLYREVINLLTPKARQALNQELINEAEQDFKNRHYTPALRKYKAVFARFYQ
jgi:hypothetical protein